MAIDFWSTHHQICGGRLYTNLRRLFIPPAVPLCMTVRCTEGVSLAPGADGPSIWKRSVLIIVNEHPLRLRKSPELNIVGGCGSVAEEVSCICLISPLPSVFAHAQWWKWGRWIHYPRQQASSL